MPPSKENKPNVQRERRTRSLQEIYNEDEVAEALLKLSVTTRQNKQRELLKKVLEGVIVEYNRPGTNRRKKLLNKLYATIEEAREEYFANPFQS